MTMQEAIAQQPQWVQLWMNWMMIGAFILPLGLFIWKQTRFAALLNLIAAILAAVGTGLLFNQLGYVKLLGLVHIIVWTPLAYFYWQKLKAVDLPKYARWIIYVTLATILISLAFDYTDVARYILGNRSPH